MFVFASWAVAAINKIRQAIGANIRQARKKAEWSQERLAEKADLHPVYISQVERGEKAVSVEALWKLPEATTVGLGP